MTPFERQQANRMTRHHLFYEKPNWQAPKAKSVRELGSFVISVPRAPHDYVHFTIPGIKPPQPKVLDVLMEVGREYQGWQNDNDRLDRITDTLAGYAQATRSPHEAHEVLTVMSSIEAQMAIVGLFKGMRGLRYE